MSVTINLYLDFDNKKRLRINTLIIVNEIKYKIKHMYKTIKL